MHNVYVYYVSCRYYIAINFINIIIIMLIHTVFMLS